MNTGDLVTPIEGSDRWLFYCPGCKHAHVYDARWTFNGDLRNPSFHPSLLDTWDSGEDHTPHRCHLFVTNGQIQFCGDCTHSLSGQTVPMVPWNVEKGYWNA